MTNETSFNTSQMLNLENSVRISSNSLFNAQNAYEASFEDAIIEETIKIEEKNQKEQKINFSSLGMPPGFILDTSLIEEFENGSSQNENSQNQKQYFNPYLLTEEI